VAAELQFPSGLPQRAAGVLLHPTSLPGRFDAGTIGADARQFIDWLASAGFSVWQFLPVGPVGPSHSPYQLGSAFAGNPLLVDPDDLAAAGWVTAGEAAGAVTAADRTALLRSAWRIFRRRADSAARGQLAAYWDAERGWLLPYALFRVARELYGDAGWWTWPTALRRRDPAAVARLLEGARERVREVAFEQYLFDQQWSRLRAHARQAGVRLFGDIPIYVDLDSADAWWHREQFRIGPDGQTPAVAGVPPDYFSADGQLWGNPLYDWDAMAADGFRWWIARMRRQCRHFDFLRLDHFRGLQAYWEVPAGAVTARGGCWREAPGAALLAALRSAFGTLPLVAEDLGVITAEVRALRDEFQLPGMLILQFAFDGSPDNPYLPANHREQSVVYTGTHDNDTLAGWYAGLDDRARRHVRDVLGVPAGEVAAAIRAAAWQSPARLAMFPLQDLLELGSEARLNTPGTVSGNWRWRFSWNDIPAALAGECRRAAGGSGRLPAGASAERLAASG
jgi:4-alpha-glucanotransferase